MLPRTAAILSPSRLKEGIRCDPRAMFACFAHGEQQTNEPESQTPTQISPHCVALHSLLKSHLQIGVETKLLPSLRSGEDALVSLLPSWSAALGPQGNDIMRIPMPTLCLISIVNAAHTLHFGPVMVALWAALRIWQSIMSAQCPASLFTAAFTAVSCTLFHTGRFFSSSYAALRDFEMY